MAMPAVLRHMTRSLGGILVSVMWWGYGGGLTDDGETWWRFVGCLEDHCGRSRRCEVPRDMCVKESEVDVAFVVLREYAGITNSRCEVRWKSLTKSSNSHVTLEQA